MTALGRFNHFRLDFNLRNYNESWYGNFVLLIDSYNLITSLNKTIMANINQANYERLFQQSVPLYCPTEDSEGNLFAVSTNGDVYQVTDGNLDVAFSTGGQPTGLVFDMQGSSFIADQAHQAILS